MKKLLIIVLGVSLFSVSSAFAKRGGQGMHGDFDKKDVEEHIQTRLKRMTKNLDLTADQQKKVEVSLRKMMTEKVAIHKETREKIKAVRDQYRSEIHEFLTPDQRAECKKTMDKQEKKKGRRGKRGKRGYDGWE